MRQQEEALEKLHADVLSRENHQGQLPPVDAPDVSTTGNGPAPPANTVTERPNNTADAADTTEQAPQQHDGPDAEGLIKEVSLSGSTDSSLERGSRSCSWKSAVSAFRDQSADAAARIRRKRRNGRSPRSPTRETGPRRAPRSAVDNADT